MTADPYERFARRWRNAHDVPQDETRTAFFRRLFNENGVPSVLDCACGSGQDLLMLEARQPLQGSEEHQLVVQLGHH